MKIYTDCIPEKCSAITDEILKNKKYAVTYRTFLFGCTGSNTKNSRDKELKITRMIKNDRLRIHINQ